jgi:hypothetical protein
MSSRHITAGVSKRRPSPFVDYTGASPFEGVGVGYWLGRSLASRSRRVAACLLEGPAPFERVQPLGYDKAIVRCARCGTLERFHRA